MKRILGFAVAVAVALWLGAMTASLTGKDRRSTRDRDNNASNSKQIDDRTFVMKAANAGTAEVALGRLAAQKAHSKAVRHFGQHMVDDHTKANRQLMGVAAKKGFNTVGKIDATHQKLMDKLSEMKGREFDRVYMHHMVKDHVKAVALFRAEAEHGKDSDLKALANKTLPTLKEHLRMAKKLDGHHKRGSRQR